MLNSTAHPPNVACKMHNFIGVTYLFTEIRIGYFYQIL